MIKKPDCRVTNVYNWFDFEDWIHEFNPKIWKSMAKRVEDTRNGELLEFRSFQDLAYEQYEDENRSRIEIEDDLEKDVELLEKEVGSCKNFALHVWW